MNQGLPDMLVDLRRLPPAPADVTCRVGVILRRACPGDAAALREFIVREFTEDWAPAVDRSLQREPVSAFVALRGPRVIGFAAYDCGHLGYFGPMGVQEDWRGVGIGGGLLLLALADMRAVNYAYAVIGQVGPIEFYEKVCGATLIPGGES
jgi:predicted N-acetyltransferase YhbS